MTNGFVALLGRDILLYNYKFNEAHGITDDNKHPNRTYIKELKRNWLLDIIYKIINEIVNIFVKHD